MVAIEGDGIRLIWTIRALERIGYAIDDNSPCRISVTDETWILHNGTSETTFSTLHDLTLAL
jgi:hypothetical protein